jgi:hypothetical protein
MRSLARLHRPVTVADVAAWSDSPGRLAWDRVATLLKAGLMTSLPLKGVYLVAGARVDSLTVFRAWLALHQWVGTAYPGRVAGYWAMSLNGLPVTLPPAIEIDILDKYRDVLTRAQADLVRTSPKLHFYQVRRRAWIDPEHTQRIGGLPVQT